MIPKVFCKRSLCLCVFGGINVLEVVLQLWTPSARRKSLVLGFQVNIGLNSGSYTREWSAFYLPIYPPIPIDPWGGTERLSSTTPFLYMLPFVLQPQRVSYWVRHDARRETDLGRAEFLPDSASKMAQDLATVSRSRSGSVSPGSMPCSLFPMDRRLYALQACLSGNRCYRISSCVSIVIRDWREQTWRLTSSTIIRHRWMVSITSRIHWYFFGFVSLRLGESLWMKGAQWYFP